MSKKFLQPDININDSIKSISIEVLKKKNIKFILLDVDGTLIPRGELNIHQSIKSKIIKLKNHFPIHLISNNPSRSRIEYISTQLNLDFTFRAQKPFINKTIEVIKHISQPKSNIAIIGDRYYSDIFVGKRLKIFTILVRPIDKNGETCKNNITQIIEKLIFKLLGLL